ncbi:MAG: TIR domain-containing protein, partial [Anaerolineales bacterium]|nr:TIR domain-containing protein [Anaerolineales bacterium]
MAEPAPQKAPRRKSNTNEDNPSVIDYGGTPEQQQTSSPSTSPPPPSTSTVEPEPTQGRNLSKIRVYLSYARKDTEFAKALYDRLLSEGFDIWVDWEDIPPSSKWLDEILNGIQTSDAFIFIISPDSLVSEVNTQELEQAIKQSKRLIPILHRNPDKQQPIHPEIASINWIYMLDAEELDRQFPVLAGVLSALSAPPGPSTTLDFALNDRPTGKDQLDYQSYARAFAQILASPHTKPPLTVGLYASWGMGKSFLMNKIKEELRSKERRSKAKDQTELVFHFIDFNAWEYSTSDNLWAGLITSLYGQVEKAYKPWQITRFRWTKRFRKNLRKTFGWGGVFTLLGVILAAFLQGDTLLQVTDSLSNLQELFGTAFLSGSTLAALIAFLRAARDLFDSTAPRSKELQSIVSRKDFSTQIGFMDEIKGEIGEMLTLIKNIEKGKREVRFVLFVDDLDRCPPNKAIEVLEALLLLLSYQEGEAPFFIFLAIDARVIVKAIEVHYGKMLTEAGISGYEFLDKVVQIPFRIPPAGPVAMKKYITSLLWQSEEARTEAENRRARATLAATPAADDTPTPAQTAPAQASENPPELIPEEPFDDAEQA